MFEYLVYISAVVQLFASFFYIKNTIKGQTKPNRVSWLMWAIAPAIATAAALSNGVGLAALPVFMSGFCPLLIFLSSFVNPKSYWKLTHLDYICGVCSILALILWGVTKNPDIAIIFAILSDAIAGLPTIIKSWKDPKSETYTPYLAGTLGSLTAFAAMKTLAFSEYAFPTYLILMNLIILFFIFKEKILKKNRIHEKQLE